MACSMFDREYRGREAAQMAFETPDEIIKRWFPEPDDVDAPEGEDDDYDDDIGWDGELPLAA